MKAKYGEDFKGIDRLESVGSAVGKQMRNQGVLSVIYALLGILLYISFRFDLRYSPGAILALIHDVSITIGIFSLFGLEFNLPIIAALLAIVGYSLNDTIVVYDRIRESLRKDWAYHPGEYQHQHQRLSLSNRSDLGNHLSCGAFYLLVWWRYHRELRPGDVDRCGHRNLFIHLYRKSCGRWYGWLPQDASRRPGSSRTC